MKTRLLEFWVGSFVLLGILAFLMLALQVSGLTSLYEQKGYTLKAVFKNIGGLKVKSKVTINGVKIGTVEKISLILDEFHEYQALVVMKINYTYKNLPKDSSAKVLTAGLLGDNYVGIEPGMEDSYLKPGDVIELTQQAILLEDLISKFAVGSNNQSNKEIKPKGN
jgi:phospholipid/cholesterol/gamma-HCH transport system substrate-binding protein